MGSERPGLRIGQADRGASCAGVCQSCAKGFLEIEDFGQVFLMGVLCIDNEPGTVKRRSPVEDPVKQVIVPGDPGQDLAIFGAALRQA